MNAGVIDASFGPFGPLALFGDGMNLYAAYGSNPITNRDPLGLDIYDDAVSDVVGNALANFGVIQTSWLGVGARTAATMIADLVGATSAARIVGGDGGIGDYLSILSGLTAGVGKFAAKGLKSLGKAIGSAFKWVARFGKASRAKSSELLEVIIGGSDDILRGKTPDDIPELIKAAKEAGWNVTTLSHGKDAGKGLKLYNPAGDELISFSPGTSARHGGPYWKVSSGKGGTRRIPAGSD